MLLRKYRQGRTVGGGGAAPLDTKRSARSAEPQYRLVRVDVRWHSVIEKIRAKHWAGSLIFSLMARRSTCTNFVFMKRHVLIRHHTPTWT